jgi:hypothetical protein
MNNTLFVISVLVSLLFTSPIFAENISNRILPEDNTRGSEIASGPTEERLLERVHKYWEAVKFRDFTTMFQMEAAALKGIMSADTLRRATGHTKLKAYNIKELKIEGEKAVIRLERIYRVENTNSAVPTVTIDPWIFIEGDWYHAQGLRIQNINPSEWAKKDFKPIGE